MATAAVLNTPGLRPTFEPVEPMEAENIQTRIAKIYAKILTILSDVSISDQEKTSSIKRQIKKLSGELAAGATWQGYTALAAAGISAAFIGYSCLGDKTPQAQQALVAFGNMASATFEKVLNSRTESQNTLTSSERDLLSKDLEKMISDSASKQGFKKEVSDLFSESLQTAKLSTRF